MISETSGREACVESAITEMHTLGPSGTNCESAANEWFRRQGTRGTVVLHRTLEEAVATMSREPGAALLSCIVYPELHTIVFSNLTRLRLVDAFIMPTYNMVLAAREVCSPKTVASHPAPRLLAGDAEVRLVTSNAVAAIVCANGEVDACVTTRTACDANGLTVIRDFGPVPMGFAVHANY